MASIPAFVGASEKLVRGFIYPRSFSLNGWFRGSEELCRYPLVYRYQTRGCAQGELGQCGELTLQFFALEEESSELVRLLHPGPLRSGQDESLHQF